MLNFLNKTLGVIANSAESLKINNVKDFENQCKKIAEDIKEKDREIDALKNKLASSEINDLFVSAKVEKGVRILFSKFDNTNGDMLRSMCQKLLSTAPKAVAVLAGICDGKVTFACCCGEEARAKGANAGKIVKAVAQIAEGNGGGKPDLAMAGAKNIDKVDEALRAVREIVLDMVQE